MSRFIYSLIVFLLPMFLFSQSSEKPADLIVVPQTGHTFNIVAISASADNRYFLTSDTDDGTTKLWSMEGRLIRTLRVAGRQPSGSTISPDGNFAIIEHNQENVLYDTKGNLIKRIQAGTGVAAFTRDSKFIIMNGENESGQLLKMYDTKGKLIRSFAGNLGQIQSIDFSNDGKLFVTGGFDNGKLGFWNLNGTLIKSVDAHSGDIHLVRFTPDGSHFITSSYTDNKSKLWTSDGVFKKEISSGVGIRDLDFAPDGKTFVTIFQDGSSVTIMDLNGRKIKELENTKGASHVAFASDGKTILATVNEGNILMFDGQGNYLRKALKGANWINDFSYYGKSAIVNGKQVWDLDSGAIDKLPQIADDISIRKGNLTADNKYILSVQDGGDGVFVFDAMTKKKINKISIPNFRSISTNNQIFSLEAKESELQLSLFDIEGNLIQKLKEPNVTGADFSPDRNYIATFGNKTLKLKDTKGKEIFSISTKEESTSLNFSTGGKYILLHAPSGVQAYNLSGKLEFALKHNGAYYTVSNSDDKFFLTGSTEEAVKLWDDKGRNIKSFPGHPNGPKGFDFTKDGKFVLTISYEGILRFFNIANGALAAQVIFTDYGVVTTAPDGRFDYSDNRAIQYISYRKGGTNEMVSLDQVFQSYYTPDLLKKILSGNLSKPTFDINVALKKNLPELKLELATQNSGKIDLNIEACDKGGGLQNIAVYQNGNLIHEENYTALTQTGACKTGTVTLNLADGQNTFKVSAYNSANIKAESPTRAVTYVSPESLKPHLHILMVAIDDYVSASSKLKFAVKDAQDLKESFRKHGKGSFGKVNFYEVYNAEGVKPGILNAFKNLKTNARLNDTVVVFFSGHGMSVDGKFYYITQNITNDSDIEAKSEAEYNQKYKAWEKYVKQGSISSDEISQAITQIKANNKMLIIDSCYSGGGWLSKVNEAKVDQKIEEQRSDMVKKSNLTGIAMISAAQDFQKANENGDVGHGFLTFGLLEAMKIEKDRGKITAFSVIPQAAKKVRELSVQYKKKQIPFQSTSGVDFELSD